MNFFYTKKAAAFRDASTGGDVYLARWSGVLHILVWLAAVFTFVDPFEYLTMDGRISLLHDGKIQEFQIWKLPPFELSVVLACWMSPKTFWLYTLFQFFMLGRVFRQGRIFDESNGRRLENVGYALATISLINTLAIPAVAFAFYWGGTTPWMADLPLAHVIEPDLAMGGLFFIILGKVMRRAAEMEEESRLIV